MTEIYRAKKKIAPDYYKKNMTKIKEKYYLLNIEQK